MTIERDEIEEIKEMESCPDERRLEAEHMMAVQSVAASIQNMLLAAHREGWDPVGSVSSLLPGCGEGCPGDP